jgi:hypothetical protein
LSRERLNLDLLLDSALRYSLPQMKANILSALIAATLAFSATAQDCNQRIALGMTFAEVASILGQPVNHSVSNDGATETWYYLADNPFSVSNEGTTLYVPYSYMVAFDSNGRVSGISQVIHAGQ